MSTIIRFNAERDCVGEPRFYVRNHGPLSVQPERNGVLYDRDNLPIYIDEDEITQPSSSGDLFSEDFTFEDSVTPVSVLPRGIKLDNMAGIDQYIEDQFGKFNDPTSDLDDKDAKEVFDNMLDLDYDVDDDLYLANPDKYDTGPV
jgi:hypothetical protein